VRSLSVAAGEPHRVSRDKRCRNAGFEGVLRTPARGRLRYVFADVFREHLVDERLVADVSAARFLAERFKHARIDADRDQSSRFVTERRPPHPPHRLELFG
jgi:hypothetical protein